MKYKDMDYWEKCDYLHKSTMNNLRIAERNLKISLVFVVGATLFLIIKLILNN